MASTTDQAARQISDASKKQSAQGLLVQTYCNSVLQQPNVNLVGTPTLATYQTKINDGLAKAKDNANLYLNKIQPMIITNMADISDYCDLYKSVPIALPENSSKQDWISTLHALKDEAVMYTANAASVVQALQDLNGRINGDSVYLTETVSLFNTAVTGDNGVLASIKTQLDDIQGKIDGTIAGIVVSGLAISGGVFITAVGEIASFVTAGTSTPLVLAGIGLIAAGVGGTVASSIVLANLNDSKGTLLRQQASLTAEVSLALGISSGYQSLSGQAKQALDATIQMKNAWDFLTNDLNNLIKNMERGTPSAAAMRALFLATANGNMTSVQKDVDIIKRQMTGVSVNVAPKNVMISTYIKELALAKAA